MTLCVVVTCELSVRATVQYMGLSTEFMAEKFIYDIGPGIGILLPIPYVYVH